MSTQTDLTGYVLLGEATAFFVLCLLLPILRMRLRSGSFGIAVHRAVNPVQRVMGVALSLWVIASMAWPVLFWILGPSTLDVWTAPRGAWLAGIALLAAGIALVVVAQWQMGASWRIGIDDAPTGLVTEGVFRIARHPIYTGLVLATAGTVLVTPSPWTVSALVMILLFLSIETRLEEEHMLATHGDAYRAYARRVGRFFPAIGRLS